MSFETINLEKGMYKTAGRSFSQVLESLDPSEHYKGTALEGLDAYQRQLKRFDIKVSGTGSDAVEKFFSTTQSAALFPEYVSRAVSAGMEQADLLSSIVATVTKIEGMDYRTITSVAGANGNQLEVVKETEEIPETVIKTQDNLITLKKRGRMLVASYEAIRFKRLDLFTVTLKQIGAYIARSQLSDAVDVLIDGDGNNNPADTVSLATTGAITYADFINLWNELDPYEMTTVITNPAMLSKILALNEFKSPEAGTGFSANGKLITPLGATLIRSGDVPTGTVLALDNRCALEMVQASDVLIEYDKLIDRQLERAAISTVSGFAKIFPDAVKTLA